MTTDNNNDGLEIPAHLKREPKAKPAAKADALNIAGATPGASVPTQTHASHGRPFRGFRRLTWSR
jgi:hypothetical protein